MRSFQARFFFAIIFYTSSLVVWKGATTSVPSKGCETKCGLYIPAHTLIWGGTISLSRWCERKRVGSAGAGVFEREDHCPGPWRRRCRAPFPSKRPSGVAQVGQACNRIQLVCRHLWSVKSIFLRPVPDALSLLPTYTYLALTRGPLRPVHGFGRCPLFLQIDAFNVQLA